MYPYDYAKDETPFNMHLSGASSTRSHYEVTFPSSCQTGVKEGNTVYASYFAPAQQDTKTPLLIISHGYGDTSLAPCLTLARLLVRSGIAAFVLYLPFHSRRLPAGGEGGTFSADTGTWVDFHRRAVIEIRQVVDWACTRPEIDHNKIGVAGISLGGMISAIAMAVDTRIREGIFVTIGGNLEEVSWGGKLGETGIGHTCTREECHAVYTHHPGYLIEVAEKGVENVTPAKECFLIDPLTFAEYLRQRPVLMINGKDDEVVSEQSTLTLWEAYGRPRLVWVPDTHAGTYSRAPLISAEIVAFLNTV